MRCVSEGNGFGGGGRKGCWCLTTQTLACSSFGDTAHNRWLGLCKVYNRNGDLEAAVVVARPYLGLANVAESHNFAAHLANNAS